MQKKTWIWTIAIAVILIALFYIPKLTDPNRAIVSRWNDAGIDCLPSHANVNSHIHPVIHISVDGKQEFIPANTGIVKSCMAEIHTHDGSGTIHVETVLSNKTFTLGKFFEVWEGKSLKRDGFNLEMTVDGEPNREYGDLILRDKQRIVLKYTRISDQKPTP